MSVVQSCSRRGGIKGAFGGGLGFRMGKGGQRAE